MKFSNSSLKINDFKFSLVDYFLENKFLIESKKIEISKFINNRKLNADVEVDFAIKDLDENISFDPFK